ncbi:MULTISPECIES: DUF4259 domain-containing protein [Saccharibacillus]|uniref:DUF4259 domain-containing protein n=1 Tax=Saccharibacillus TaxID=456492 RepID=UPI00123BD780|nr:DUF4259 domain-containing protein [Saccharibacillus sp. WB 17]MWJ33847.1 DUF4259 domain-containing protein [Saccharibacillus sp. WB 17]
MGAWGYGIFENDDTMDWQADLVRSEGLDMLRESIERAVGDEDMEAQTASIALGAIAVLAALQEQALNAEFEHMEELQAWIHRHRGTGTELNGKARQAIQQILEQSELKELWEDTDEYAEWEGTVTALGERLGE